MPDLLTHLAGAYLVKKSFRLVGFASIFYLGALLPDLLSRPLHIIWPRTFPATQPFHTPVGALIACWLLSLFFCREQRKPVFGVLFAGCALHFLMDMTQKHLVGGYLWLFPFSLRPFSFGFIHPEGSLTYLPLTLFTVFLVYTFSARKEKRRSCQLTEKGRAGE